MATKDTFGRKPQNFKGTRDYDGIDAKKREFVISQIRNVFELFGFEPLKTPAIELDRILTDKYGEEGETKRFRTSARGEIKPDNQGGLRYDHTVPLARFMAMNPSKKVLPYRRYAIGDVWRNEDVQCGRLREFTQCDFDTVGSSSLVVDAEILAINYQVLTNLGFPAGSFILQYNDRRLLNVMTNTIGCNDANAIEVLRAWDKLEKVGLEATAEELRNKIGLPSTASESEKKEVDDLINNYLKYSEELLKAEGKLDYLQSVLGDDGQDALKNINNIYQYALSMGVPQTSISFNPLLARGLDYYTGPIFETVIAQSGIGSISGGGRFDKLISDLGGPNLPASGSSFGLERVMSVMEQLGIKTPVGNAAPVFLALFDKENLDLVKYSFRVASKLRLDGIPVEVYTGANAKLGKQIEIANRKGAQIVLILGDRELSEQKVTVKLLSNGEQFSVDLQDLTQKLQSLLS